MNFNPDDPKWTAYVLGELDPSERAEMDTLLENSEDARSFVQELRDATTALHEEMKVAMMQPIISGLTREQRAAVHAAAGNGKARWFNWNATMAVGALAVAALILFAVALPMLRKSGTDAGKYQSVMPTAKLEKTQKESQAATNAATPTGSERNSGALAETLETRQAVDVKKSERAEIQTPTPPPAATPTPISQANASKSARYEQPAAQPTLNLQANVTSEVAAKRENPADPGINLKDPAATLANAARNSGLGAINS